MIFERLNSEMTFCQLRSLAFELHFEVFKTKRYTDKDQHQEYQAFYPVAEPWKVIESQEQKPDSIIQLLGGKKKVWPQHQKQGDEYRCLRISAMNVHCVAQQSPYLISTIRQSGISPTVLSMRVLQAAGPSVQYNLSLVSFPFQ